MSGRVMVAAAGTLLVLGLLWARTSIRHPVPGAPRLSLTPDRMLADGYDLATLTIQRRGTAAPRISIVENPHGATVEEVTGSDGRWEAQIRAGIVPGQARIRVAFPDGPPAFAQLETLLDTRDSLEDGTPDFLRLTDDRDRRAFRRWFTWLAEAQYFQTPAARPPEIDDCAALIRYSYREALHAHDPGWAAAAQLPIAPALDPVAKYRYPYTPLGAALFRVRPGSFRASDLTDGAFAQFADAQTLWRLNCHFVSREVSAALPGDLFFFRQEEGRERFHSMIYLGDSQIRQDGRRYVVYHTGAGEMRRLTMAEMATFPQSEWRPLASNAEFLGVYRWNILCSAGH